MMVSPEIRRKLLLCGIWIGTILLAGSFLWIGTQSYRSRLLAQAVQTALAAADSAIMVAASPGGGPSAVLGGAWFAASGCSGSILVFTILHGGIAAVNAAKVDSGGTVTAIIPLGANARQLMEGLPQRVYTFHADRIQRYAQRKNPLRSSQ